jgi:hypothetical protein
VATTRTEFFDEATGIALKSVGRGRCHGPKLLDMHLRR